MLKKLLLIIFCALTFIQAHAERAWQRIENLAQEEILTPSFALQSREKIVLNNGLKIYLISDPAATTSGAMMSVNVGSWQNPEEAPGLAHFLEHMLFLGTEEFPVESEYQQYITEHGGQLNAFTTSTSTNYLFTVNQNAFDGALQRFASFFKSPLFSPSGVEREVNAINQEWAKNIENDSVRLFSVIKELANPRHPFHRFEMGNAKSLKDVSQETLKQWYTNHYSADQMRLVVFSSQPIDKLRELAVKNFVEVKKSPIEPVSIQEPIFTDSTAGKMIYIEPIGKKQTLTLLWEIPQKIIDSNGDQTDALVSFVLGHEGQASLLAQLKREELAESLACGSINFGNLVKLFAIEVSLTDEGIKEVDQVIFRTFQAIKNFSENGMPDPLFKEIQTMSVLDYKYQTKKNEFKMLENHARKIQEESFETYPEKSLITQEFDGDKILNFLQELTPKKARFILTAPSLSTHIKMESKEPWMGAPYSIKSIPKEKIKKWVKAKPHPEIDLPEKNHFISEEFPAFNNAVKKQSRIIPEIQKIHLSENAEIFFAQDQQFGLPKVDWIFDIKTPEIVLNDAKKIVLCDIWVKSLQEALNTISYPAKMAGLDFTVSRKDNAIRIQISGYEPKAALLLVEILASIERLDLSPKSFKLHRNTLLREYQNFSKESPIQQSFELFKSVVYKDYVLEEQKAQAIKNIKFEQFEEYQNNLFNQTYLTAILYGSLNQDQALEISNSIQNRFLSEVYPKDNHINPQVITLSDQKGPFIYESETKQKGNATILSIENPNFSFKRRAAQEILMQAIEEPFYSSLRTKQQTGYIVASLGKEMQKKMFNIFAVQSVSHDTNDLLWRFESFIEDYLKNQMPDLAQFQRIKQAKIDQIKQAIKNSEQMAELILTIISDYDADFDWMEKRLDGVKSLTYDEFVAFIKETLGKENKRRVGILLNGQIPKSSSLTYKKARTWSAVRQGATF